MREGAADPDRAVRRSRVRRRGPGRNESLRTGGCGSVCGAGCQGHRGGILRGRAGSRSPPRSHRPPDIGLIGVGTSSCRAGRGRWWSTTGSSWMPTCAGISRCHRHRRSCRLRASSAVPGCASGRCSTPPTRGRHVARRSRAHRPRTPRCPGPRATSDPWGSRPATDTVVPGQGSARRPVTPGSAGPGRLSPRGTARSSPSAARAWWDPESPASVARSEPGPPDHARATARGCRRSPVDGMRLEQPLSKPLTPAMVLITSHSMANSFQIVGIMDPTTRSSSE